MTEVSRKVQTKLCLSPWYLFKGKKSIKMEIVNIQLLELLPLGNPVPFLRSFLDCATFTVIWFFSTNVYVFENCSVCHNIGKAISKATNKRAVQCLMPSFKQQFVTYPDCITWNVSDTEQHNGTEVLSQDVWRHWFILTFETELTDKTK